MSLARLMILLTALVFAAYGVGFIVAPLSMLEWATGAVVNTPSAIIDLRATYGGLSLAVGLVLYGLKRHTAGLARGDCAHAGHGRRPAGRSGGRRRRQRGDVRLPGAGDCCRGSRNLALTTPGAARALRPPTRTRLIQRSAPASRHDRTGVTP